MQRWRGLDSTPSGWGRCVVTIGVFDGVHRGHQQIVGRAVDRARETGMPSVVLTFDPHPSEVVRPGSHPPVLTSTRRKAALLEALGADVACVLPFTLEFSRLGPAEFVHEVLVEHLHAAAVVVGDNFRFGHRAAGDVAALRSLGDTFGFVTEGVPLLTDDGVTISSTYVRSCVDAGDVAAAAHALGREHRIEGLVVRGDMRGGSQLGFPTANLRVDRYAAVPADGVYAGRLLWRDAARPAAISVGSNPTFEGRERRVEAFVLDFDGDLYGEKVGLDFHARLRGMQRYDRIDDLIAQIKVDVDQTRTMIP
ncbi:MAG: bifunctional riboflavin kinase/FAD synthetase [Actinobacteria bacterium]|nr:bifunctional riboflavin kinase/FAD synthetase [Actinomycetota bacterium]